MTENPGKNCGKAPQRNEIASGEGWRIADVICHAGPSDRPYEELHTRPCIAIVVAGTFQYRSSRKPDLMTPGSILLGNAGECFTCGHEHGTGDRCISFSYDAGLFECVAHEAGGRTGFKAASLPPIRALAAIAAKASALCESTDRSRCEEIAIELAARAIEVEGGIQRDHTDGGPGPLARVSRVIRAIENEPGLPVDLASLARMARLSPYHFLRTFQGLTGVTPHQYLLRARLRRAAVRLVSEERKVAEIAFDCGFGDLSNFNRAFRNEFGMTPRIYRRTGL
ncbi:MAG TPA: AraC family transcriptional regulator [Bryobacteraceae bacterium]|nr:AraC family transcriptional regulator [Bryobacteraceae bacterium]